MYAVIQTGGKQYTVREGQNLKVEKIDAEEGAVVEFDQVLLVSDNGEVKMGTPLVDNAKVTAKVVKQGRGRKVEIIKFRRRKDSRLKKGHRQYFTEVVIDGISA